MPATKNKIYWLNTRGLTHYIASTGLEAAEKALRPYENRGSLFPGFTALLTKTSRCLDRTVPKELLADLIGGHNGRVIREEGAWHNEQRRYFDAETGAMVATMDYADGQWTVNHVEADPAPVASPEPETAPTPVVTPEPEAAPQPAVAPEPAQHGKTLEFNKFRQIALLEPAQHERLHRTAEQEGISASEIIRRALEAHLAPPMPPGEVKARAVAAEIRQAIAELGGEDYYLDLEADKDWSSWKIEINHCRRGIHQPVIVWAVKSDKEWDREALEQVCKYVAISEEGWRREDARIEESNRQHGRVRLVL